MERQKRRLAYLLITPAALWLLVFIGVPILDTIRTSFYRTTYLGDKFAGLFNYAMLPGDEVFRLIVRNSVVWTAGAVLLNVGLGLLVALLLSRATVFSEIARGSLVLAWATPFVVAAITWKWMYNGEYGQLNSALQRLQLIHEPIQWLTNAAFRFHRRADRPFLVGAAVQRFCIPVGPAIRAH